MPKVQAKNRMMLKVHAGEAEVNSEKLNLSYTTQGTPVITFEDGTTVYWGWKELIEQAIKLKDRNEVCDSCHIDYPKSEMYVIEKQGELFCTSCYDEWINNYEN